MRKFDNFCKSLEHLSDIYNYSPPYNSVELTGMVGLFEICFEQSWKAMKEILSTAGYSESRTGSPRSIIKTAYAAGMLDDEDAWLNALSSRNNVAHAYNENIALRIIQDTKDSYYPMFLHLRDTIIREWTE